MYCLYYFVLLSYVLFEVLYVLFVVFCSIISMIRIILYYYMNCLHYFVVFYFCMLPLRAALITEAAAIERE